jgi:hypothetical protein
VYGPESSGKTTLALHAIAEVQRQGGTAALIDAEHAFDPEYSRVRPAGRVPREPSALRLAFVALYVMLQLSCGLHGCGGQHYWPGRVEGMATGWAWLLRDAGEVGMAHARCRRGRHTLRISARTGLVL